jgi:site-specific DNA-cytosine methylase
LFVRVVGAYVEDRLGHTFSRQLRHMSTVTNGRLQSGLETVAVGLGSTPLTYGTFFSGCELFVHVLHAVQHRMASCHAVHLQFEHVFSVEVDAWKRDFLLTHATSRYVMKDVVALSQADWRGECRTGEVVTLPRCDILAAGFECDTVSSLNRFSGARGVG